MFSISLGRRGGEANEYLHGTPIQVILGANEHQRHLQSLKQNIVHDFMCSAIIARFQTHSH